jgi:DNA segregation ATPase FtsK/SpoIIIE, S-DNA-T family
MARKRRKNKGLRRLLPDLNLNLSLNLDQWLDILGYFLLAIAGLTLLSFPSANHGVIPTWWLGVLRWAFGWGAYLIPMLLGAVGLWLILRRFGDKLPNVKPQQVVGAMVSYLTLLITLHLPTALILFDGDLSKAADARFGGGHLGAALTRPLLMGLGSAGLIVALLTWWLILIALTFEITLTDILAKSSGRAFQHLLRKLGLYRHIAPSPSVEEQVTEQPAPSPQPQKTPPAKKPKIAPKPSPRPTAPIRSHTMGDDKQHSLPPIEEILEPGNDHEISASILRRQARIIEETMESLGAPVRVQEINHGPVVTQFGIEPLVINKSGKERKVKVSRITSLADDLALALEAKSVRVEVPIPGKHLIGLEIPNPESAMVALWDVITSEAFTKRKSKLRLCLGQDVSGNPVVTNLDKMPHLLIAGATGSGKSICLNAIIAALLLQNTPSELRFLMVDPKRVELTGYDGIPHLLADVVVDMERVTGVLNWILQEMDARYRRFSETRSSHIVDYNKRVAPRRGEKRLPYIVVVVDELADLMMVSPHEVERSICRIAQMARATGIHMIIATQRPSVDVVTGLIKANFPARIAFNVASSVDSRVILDMAGAEQLLGRGDMLFLPPDAPTPMRLQGTFVSDMELHQLVHYWKEEALPKEKRVGEPVQPPLWEMEDKKPSIEYEDELLPDVIELVLKENRASISLMQRKLRIGYTRAARLMDILEDNEVVGPQPSGGKAREVFPEAARNLLKLPEEG